MIKVHGYRVAQLVDEIQHSGSSGAIEDVKFRTLLSGLALT
jgi:hypothetical protein